MLGNFPLISFKALSEGTAIVLYCQQCTLKYFSINFLKKLYHFMQLVINVIFILNKYFSKIQTSKGLWISHLLVISLSMSKIEGIILY